MLRLVCRFAAAASLPALLPAAPPASRVEKHAVYETSFRASGSGGNPYTAIQAEAVCARPGGAEWRAPLFWDGGTDWKLRLSPDAAGRWSCRVRSSDAGLNGQARAFDCTESSRAGGLTASREWPGHFARQNGAPFWFLGDTGWGYFTDSAENGHDRAQAERYAAARAAQGFNVIHSMLLSEAGDGNRNGPPFTDISSEQLNPGYWREADERLAFANRSGLTVGLALAWGDKRKVEPYAWGRLPGIEARKRYARYIAARYAAFDVYFLVSGEWHAEIRSRRAGDDEVFREFVAIGEALAAADPHHRMIGIHPMSAHGSVREFRSAPWMSFADYQQNYRDLHARIRLSRHLPAPVVNSEYGYLFRDQNGDGTPDKDNSHTVEDMRFASWDIAMAGGYFVTGFGTTYFAGHRDPGPFDPAAGKNREWEAQAGHIRRFFQNLRWWKLAPADELVSSEAKRTPDRVAQGRVQPPATTFWALAEPGEVYVLYVRGTRAPVDLNTGARARRYRIRQFDPRTGAFQASGLSDRAATHRYQPPDERDWAVLLEAVADNGGGQ